MKGRMGKATDSVSIGVEECSFSEIVPAYPWRLELSKVLTIVEEERDQLPFHPLRPGPMRFQPFPAKRYFLATERGLASGE